MNKWGMSLLILSSLIGLMILVSCSNTSTQGEDNSSNKTDAKIDGGTINVAFSAEPESIDWMYTGATATRDVGWHIFETLFALDRDYKVRPMIAKDYEVSEDQKLYTITLREDVKFHDGTIVTSEDVIASIERWLIVSGVGTNVGKYIDEVEAIDDHTITIQLNQVYNSLLADFAAPKQALMIIPANIAEEAGEQPLTPDQLIGTGPYMLKQWDRGKEIVLEKFADYSTRDEDWGGLTGEKIAYFDEIKFQIVKDPQVMINGLKTGLYDYAESIAPDLYEVIENTPHIEPITYINGYTVITPNKATKPFDDLKARQAVNYALDRETIAKSVYGNEQFYAFDGALFDPEQVELYSEHGTDAYNVHDQQTAKELLQSSSYDGETIKIMFSNNHIAYEKTAEIVKQQLETVGFQVELISYEWATYLEKWRDPDNWDLVIVGWSTRFSPNELGMLGIGSSSSGFYESDRWENLLDEWSRYETDEEKQDILTNMNETVWDELPFIKIVNETTLDIKSDQVKDFESWVGQRFWNTYKSD